VVGGRAEVVSYHAGVAFVGRDEDFVFQALVVAPGDDLFEPHRIRREDVAPEIVRERDGRLRLSLPDRVACGTHDPYAKYFSFLCW